MTQIEIGQRVTATFNGQPVTGRVFGLALDQRRAPDAPYIVHLELDEAVKSPAGRSYSRVYLAYPDTKNIAVQS